VFRRRGSRAPYRSIDTVELEWLRTFLAVVDRGGFSAASSEIHRSQSRVSAHIAALERTLRTRLIDRSARPVALTAAGAVLVHHARQILAGVDEARSAVATVRGVESGEISIFTTPCIGAAFVPEVLTEFTPRYPYIRITVVERTSPEPEPAESVLALLPAPAAGERSGDRPQEQPLWRERLRLVVSADHRLARWTGPVSVSELADEQLIGLGAIGIETDIPIAISAEAPQTVVALARAGLGIGLINNVALQTCVTGGTVALDVDHPGWFRVVTARWHDGLLDTEPGRALHKAVLAAPPPAGGERLGDL
jgi:DNA-binding transcriptional LysR family regulator